MAVRPQNVMSHAVVGACDRSREAKTSRRLWAHKYELFIEGGGYSYAASRYQNCWTGRVVQITRKSVLISGTKSAPGRL
jgi:hypothetical protein